MGDRKFRLLQVTLVIQLKVKLSLQMMQRSSLLTHFHDSRKVNKINRKQKLKHHLVSHLRRHQQRFTLLTLDFLDPRQELSLHIIHITDFSFSCFYRHPVARRGRRDNTRFTKPLTAKVQLRHTRGQAQ